MTEEVRYDPDLSWEENCARAEPHAIRIMPYVRGDLPAYQSPITGKPIEGRAARREDLARHGCREVDPSEYKPVYKNYAFCQKHRKPYLGDDVPPPMTRDETEERKEIRAKHKAVEKAADAVRAEAAAKTTDPDLPKFVRGNPYTETLSQKLKARKSSSLEHLDRKQGPH